MSRATFLLVGVTAGLGLTSNPASAQVAPGQQMTPQQMQAIINMRALQMRGGGQIRTGYPQDIQFGAPPVDYSQQEQQANPDRKAATQKRIEARKAAEEKKRAARDEAKAKKGKAGANVKDSKDSKDEQANAKDAKKGTSTKSAKTSKKVEPIKSTKGSKKSDDEKTAK